MRDWVITTTGKVVRRDKVKDSDTIEENVHGHENSFPDKEAAYIVRDAIIDEFPAAFLQSEAPTTVTKMPRKKTVSQDEFREQMRTELSARMNMFWADWAKLKPKERCMLFYKMMPFGYSQAPTEKPLDADAKQKQLDSKRAQAAERIADGIVDENFEDE